jgi:hypothetical protein
MLNRRELIASTVALSVTMPMAARSAAAVSGGATGPTEQLNEQPARYFVASRDLPGAQTAAIEAEAHGATVLWLDADVTPVYTRLDLALRPAPFAVAGLTSAHHLFVLERLGWDRGLRTVRRQEMTGARRTGREAGGAHGTAIEWRLEPRARR